MKHDSIFYQIFKRFPALIFELVDDRPRQAQNYRFESVEVKEISFRIDAVFLPQQRATKRIIFLITNSKLIGMKKTSQLA